MATVTSTHTNVFVLQSQKLIRPFETSTPVSTFSFQSPNVFMFSRDTQFTLHGVS